MRLFFALILAALLLPAVSGEDHTVLVSQSADGSSYYFEPEVLNIEVGDNVTFVWLNGSHNVVQSSDSASNVYLAGGFSSGVPQVGGNWSLPSDYTSQDGTLYYICEPHATMQMKGSIIVGTGEVPLPEISMEFGNFPWLSYLLIFPLIGALWTFGFRDSPHAPRIIALFTTLFTLIISFIVFFKTGSKSGYSLMEEYVWAPNFGISLLLGVDGLSSPMVLLTGIIGPLTVIFAWHEKEKPALFFALLLVMQTALFGVFITLDYFVFYVFWEIVLIPMFFLIAIWGGENRRYASIKFFIYTFTASVIMLVGFMALYFETGAETFSMIEIAKQNGNFSESFQIWVFAALFIGFAV